MRSPAENILEGLHKIKIRYSVQLQIVPAVHDPEIVRTQEMPSCSSEDHGKTTRKK